VTSTQQTPPTQLQRSFVGLKTHLIVPTLVLTSGSILFGQIYYQQGIVVLLVEALFFCFPRRFTFSAAMTLLTGIVLVAQNFLLHQENPSGHIALTVKLLAVFCIIATLNLSSGAIAYVNIVTTLAALSLPFYIFGALNPEYIRSAIEGTPAWSHDYRITPFYVFGFWDMSRNQGIFWEPSAFAIILNLAIAILLLYGGASTPGIKLAILTAALFTTMSTQGYIVLALIVAAYLFGPGATKRPLLRFVGFGTLVLQP
jgi:hypothetical protein